MTEIILFNIAILSVIAVIAAIVLYFTAKKFRVEPNVLAEEIAEIADSQFIVK